MQTTLFQKTPEKKNENKERKYQGFPCDKAQDLPIEQRPEHMKNCNICKKLERELDTYLGVKNHLYS